MFSSPEGGVDNSNFAMVKSKKLHLDRHNYYKGYFDATRGPILLILSLIFLFSIQYNRNGYNYDNKNSIIKFVAINREATVLLSSRCAALHIYVFFAGWRTRHSIEKEKGFGP